MSASVCGLYHYPIKGLSAQALRTVDLEPGKGFPFDRIFGLARHDSGYDPDTYRALPKTRFIVLVKEERLAGLATFFDSAEGTLKIHVQGQLVLAECLNAKDGRRNFVEFFAKMFSLRDGREPILAVGGENRFTDISVYSEQLMNSISLINVDTVDNLSAKIDADIDPLRFRANLYMRGLPAYQELDMVGREIEVGQVRLRIVRRTRRCAATEVDPTTARRDMALPRLLMKHLGHADLGVYADVIRGGSIEVGSRIFIP